MKQFLSFILLASFVSLQAQDVDLEALDRHLEDARKQYRLKVPALAVGIVKEDSVIFAKSYGFKDIVDSTAISLQSIFRISSCTKAFTATAIGILVDEGKLNWDDRVVDHLPWFELHDPYVTRELRVVDLLCHRSGLGHLDGELLWYGTHYSMEEVVRRIRYLPLDYGIRYQFGYQNITYITAGLLIEHITGVSWQQFVRERLLEPLDMSYSTTGVDEIEGSLLSNRAWPYGNQSSFPEIDYSNGAPAVGINSSVMDLTNWLRFWLNAGVYENDTLLSPATYAKLIQPHTLVDISYAELQGGAHYRAYGLGWYLYDFQGTQVVQHVGVAKGYKTQLVWLPEEKLGFVILTNGDGLLFESTKLHLMDQFMGRKGGKNWVKALIRHEEDVEAINLWGGYNPNKVGDTEPSNELEAYVGTYKDPMYGEAKIMLKNGGLWFAFSPTAELLSGYLKHWEHDSFVISFRDPSLKSGLLIFETNEEEEVIGFSIEHPSSQLDFANLHFTR